MKSLTVAYITAREKPCISWFVDSLAKQVKRSDPIEVIIVDLHAEKRNWKLGNNVRHVEPKPTVWQGKHRVTKENWWSASNSRNTAICLCRTEWIAFLDDRSVLLPGWLEAVKRAQAGNYAVCGAYEKRTGITVEKGVIRHAGIITGQDCREQHMITEKVKNPMPAHASWWFGCSNAVPLEWALDINGYDEICDGAGFEDVFFGFMLANNGYPMKYDRLMKIIEDRTPEHITDSMKKTDKGVSPNDKSHKLVEMLKDRKNCMHGVNLREVRQQVLAGRPWPPPWGPEKDFYDGQLVKDFA